MLVIVDEASGVADESWQAIDSLGFSKMLVAGNPIRSDGKFAALCDLGDRDALEQRPPHLACRHLKSGVGSSFLPEKMNRHWIIAGLPDYARKDEPTRITPTPDYALAPLHPAAR